MKLARFHINRGDEVKFVSGCDLDVAGVPDLFNPKPLWDRVYITTLFTFHWRSIVETISFYKEAVGGTARKVFVGGIMASLMDEEIFEETGVYPRTGILTSPSQIDLPGEEDIDALPPYYSLLDATRYAISDTYYGYTSRGCVNSCPWCGVPRIEPKYIPYIDIKPMILTMRDEYGDKSRLRLMDNNVLASPQLEQIVEDLVSLGYGRDSYTDTQPRKQRVVDFNQGLDASFLNDKRMKLMSVLNIKPMRIAFDRASEEKHYLRAVRLARKYGVREFSNYMLYNWQDSPRDLFERLVVNIRLNEEWGKGTRGEPEAAVYSYPMRFAPIDNQDGRHNNRSRDLFRDNSCGDKDWLTDAVWTKRFVRNVEIMKGAAHGAISPTATLAWRTIGETFEEFLSNLYMPEELLRNRNKHESRVHEGEPNRKPGSGKVEAFRAFVLGLLRSRDARFTQFHNAVAHNSVARVRKALRDCQDRELRQWLELYLRK